MAGPWPFVGRTDELRTALEALDGPDAGGGVLFSGVPGIGRTRVLRALVEKLDPERYVVLRAFGSRATSGIHLGALAHLLPPGELTASDPQRLLGRAFDLLRRDASGRRTVLAVDDIHHLDPLGAAFVHAAVRGEVASLAATACTDEPMPPAVATLLHDDVLTEVGLTPLRREDVRELLESLLGGSVEPESCRRFGHLTQGLPLLVRELVESDAGRQAFVRTDDVWCWRPEGRSITTSATAPALRRLDELPPQVRRVLDLVALAEPVNRSDVVFVESPSAVEAAVATGIVESLPDGPEGVLRFSRPLEGELVRQRLDAATASQGRRHLAVAICAREIGQADAMRLALWHADHGTPVAAEILVMAAGLAYGAGDLRLALRLAQAPGVRVCGFAGAEVLANALGFAGRPADALRTLEQAASLIGSDEERARWHTARGLIGFNLLHDVTVVEALFEAGERLGSPAGDILRSLASCLQAARGEIGAAAVTLDGLVQDSTGPARLHSAAMLLALDAMRGRPGLGARLRALDQDSASLRETWPTLRATSGFARWVVMLTTGLVDELVPEDGSELMRFFPMVDVQWLLGQSIAARLRGRSAAALEAAERALALAEAGGQIFVVAALAEVAAAAALGGDVDRARAPPRVRGVAPAAFPPVRQAL
jgi:hypothetical protein